MPKNLLIIGFVWPEPKSSAAGGRMMQLIYAFQSKGYKIIFATPCAKSDNAFKLESIGVEQKTISLNNSDFDFFIKKLNPAIVVFDRFLMEEQFGWRVTEQCPSAIKILDTEDLHCLRKGRGEAFKDGKPFDQVYLFNDIAKREIASIYRCDLSLIISEYEMNILTHDFKVDKALLVYLPFMLDKLTEQKINSLPKFESRNNFITIGNFLHKPNYNAVLYLKETIWPLIRKQMPKAELHVYGAYVTQKVYQLENSKTGFFIKGYTDSVDEVMKNAKVCLAPIRFGAGLKGKLVDAMQNGTPFITTTIGAEGIFGDLNSNMIIENDPQEFANKSVALYSTESLWNNVQQAGFTIINKRFSKNEHKKRLIDIINETESQLDLKRINNFTGQMLQYHTMQSTKYMSRWIEEKNKSKVQTKT